jgi:hypothetical protein
VWRGEEGGEVRWSRGRGRGRGRHVMGLGVWMEGREEWRGRRKGEEGGSGVACLHSNSSDGKNSSSRKGWSCSSLPPGR